MKHIELLIGKPYFLTR